MENLPISEDTVIEVVELVFIVIAAIRSIFRKRKK